MRRAASKLGLVSQSDGSAGNGKDNWAIAGVAVVVFALNEYFHNKPGQVVLIVLGSWALAFLGALIYVNGFLWVMEKLGYKAGPRSFKATMTSTGIVFFALWAAWAYAVFSGRY